MADAVVKFKIWCRANGTIKLLFGDKDTIKINGLSKTPLPNNSTFDVSVDWGDGVQQTYTDVNDIYKTYPAKGAKQITVTGGWSDGSGNRYLSFPKCKVKRTTNNFIKPYAKQFLTIKDNYLCIKFKGDYIGLSSESTINAIKGQKIKFVNNTGSQITIGTTDIANEAEQIITLPSDAETLTVTFGTSLTATIILNDNYGSNEPKRTGLFKNLYSATHIVYNYPYNRKPHSIGGVNKKLVPGNKLASEITVNGNFKLHGEGDFAFFDKLKKLKYKHDLGDTEVGEANKFNSLQVANFKYTFSGCINLLGSSTLLSKMQCRPNALEGTFSGMSTEVPKTGAKWQTPPTFRGNFKKVTKIDYMAESSNFDVDISSWNFADDKITSAVGFAQNSDYDKDISSITDKLAPTATITDMFEGNDSIDTTIVSTIEDTVSSSSGNQGLSGEDDSESGNYKPANKADLEEAVREWCDNETYALSVYGDINTWDVSGITDMSGLFEYKIDFNSEIGNWDVSNVLTMENMFRGARAFNQDIGQWDVGQVKNMEKMFLNAALFNKDIGNWSTDNVTNMADMFSGTRVFNQDIGQWNVSSVTTMANMFYNSIAFNQDISGWTLSSLENTSGMFLHAFSFNQDIGDWDISNIQFANGMFTGVTLSIANYDALLIGWSTKTNTEGNIPTGIAFHGGNSRYSAAGESAKLKLTGTHGWDIEDGGLAFKPESNTALKEAVDEWCENSTTATEKYGDINTWDVSGVTNMSNLFNSKTSFNSDISNWDVSSVTNMYNMFGSAHKFNQDISNWDVSNVENMHSMFGYAKDFNQDISSWDVSSVTNMRTMFTYAEDFDQSLADWDISSVTDMVRMFEENTLSTANYDATLVGWSTKTEDESQIPTDITFDAGNSRYASSGSSAKNTLIESYNWDITDNGSVNRIELIIDKNLRSSNGSYMIDLSFSTVEDGNYISMNAVPIDDEGNEFSFDTDTEYGRAQAWQFNRLKTTDVGNYAPNPYGSNEWNGYAPTAFSTNQDLIYFGGNQLQYNVKFTLSGDFTTFRVKKHPTQTNAISEIKVIGCPNYNLRSWEEVANSGYKPALAEDMNLGITKIDLSEYTGQVTDAKNLMTYQDKLAYIDIRNVDFSLCTNFENAFSNIGTALGNDVEKTYLGFNDIDFSSIPPKNSQDSTVKYGTQETSPITNIFINSTVADAVCYGNGTSLYAQGVKFEDTPVNFPHLSGDCLPNGWEVV